MSDGVDTTGIEGVPLHVTCSPAMIFDSAFGILHKGTKSTKGFDLNSLVCFLVPMLQRGNAYHMGSHAGAWEPGECTMPNKGSNSEFRTPNSVVLHDQIMQRRSEFPDFPVYSGGMHPVCQKNDGYSPIKIYPHGSSSKAEVPYTLSGKTVPCA